MLKNLLSPLPWSADWASLLLRLSFGGWMLFNHGWPKWAGFAEMSADFYDFIGIGSSASLALAVFAEVGCSLLLMLGLGTRLAVIPLIITMLVAAFGAHAGDPLAKKELPLLYVMAYTAIFLLGSGRFSLDALWVRSQRVRVTGFTTAT